MLRKKAARKQALTTMGNKCPRAAGSFLVVQLLDSVLSLPGPQVQSPVRELETPLAVLCNPKQKQKLQGCFYEDRKTPAVKNSMSGTDYRKQPTGPGLVTTVDGAEVRTSGTRVTIPSEHGVSASNVAVVGSLSRVQLCDPMSCSTPSFPVLHYLWEFAQTHVH